LCAEARCDGRSFTEQAEVLAAPRALLSSRACWWAVGQLRREHTSVAGLARALGTTWTTVWRAVCPLLKAMAAAPERFPHLK
jgi:transposase